MTALIGTLIVGLIFLPSYGLMSFPYAAGAFVVWFVVWHCVIRPLS